jgi:regulatory protein
MTNIITDILPLDEDPNYRVIYVNNTPEATIPTDTVDKIGLTVEQLWTEDVTLQIQKLQYLEVATNMALKLISMKAWGVKELATRLVKRGIDPATATIATEQLHEDGWLDDFKYACARIRDWTRSKPASRTWLKQKLKERQLSDACIDDAVEEEFGEQCEQDAATELAKLQLVKMHSLDKATTRRRLIAALGRRGFSSDVASEALRRAQSNAT